MAHSNYSDAKYGVQDEKVLPIPDHRVMMAGTLALGCATRHDPNVGSGDSGVGPKMNLLPERSSGDHFWKPLRDRALGNDFVAYKPPKHHPLCRVRPFACGCGA